MKHQSVIEAIERNVRRERRRDVERVRSSGESAAVVNRENGAFGLGLLKRGGVNWHRASRALWLTPEPPAADPLVTKQHKPTTEGVTMTPVSNSPREVDTITTVALATGDRFDIRNATVLRSDVEGFVEVVGEDAELSAHRTTIVFIKKVNAQ